MLFVIGLTHWAKRFRSHGEKAGLVMFDPEVNVSEILKSKKASIKNAALPPGSPSWDQIQELTWAEVEEGAQQGKSGFRTIRKLLSNSRFDK